MIRIDEQVKICAKRYYETFGEPLPLRMLPQTMTNEMLCQAVESCIARNVNDLLIRFCSEQDDDILI